MYVFFPSSVPAFASLYICSYNSIRDALVNHARERFGGDIVSRSTQVAPKCAIGQYEKKVAALSTKL